MNAPHDDHGAAPPHEVHRPGRMQVTPRLVATVAGLVLAVVFILSNREDAPVSFLGWNWTLPLWLALMVATFLGLVVGAGLGYRRGRESGPGRPSSGGRRGKKEK